MKAVYYERKGAARDVLILGERPRPEPGPDEVLVRVITSGVNPTDTKARSGWRSVPMAFPWVIPHQDGAGVIEAVGANVPPSRVGERVWIYEAQWQRPFGTAADFTTVKSNQAIPLPSHVSFEEGACLGIPAMTAHRCIHADGSVAGQTVFVAGGAGAVAFYAIQFAKLAGATVITTVSSDHDAKAVSEIGADIVINRLRDDVESSVREATKNKGVDRIVEVAFSENAYLDSAIISESGKIAAYASDAEHEPRFPFYGFMMKNALIHFVLVYRMSGSAHQEATEEITNSLTKKLLKHPPRSLFPLSDVVRAHEASESRSTRCKVIVELTSREG